MTAWNKITCWENKRRVEFLRTFRSTVVTYFNHCHSHDLDWHEDKPTEKARQNINVMLAKAEEVVHSSGVSSVYDLVPLPARNGGAAGTVDVLSAIFSIQQFHSSRQPVTDVIDRAIGVYYSDRRRAQIRTFNPFFWLGRFLSLVASLPFKLLGSVGFNQEKLETSRIGRFVKEVFQIVIAIASLLYIAQFLGEREAVLSWLKSISPW